MNFGDVANLFGADLVPVNVNFVPDTKDKEICIKFVRKCEINSAVNVNSIINGLFYNKVKEISYNNGIEVYVEVDN